MSEPVKTEAIPIISDLHGYYEPFKATVDYYGDKPDRYLVNGDLIGQGPATAQVLDLALEIDADVTLGNWELYWLAGMLHEDEETQQRIQRTVRVFSDRFCLGAIAASYGIKGNRMPRGEKVERLKEAMLEKGHLQMLARAGMYFEGKDFVAVHAGLTDTGLLLQKQEMFYARQDLLKVSDEDYLEPPQITDLALAHSDKATLATNKVLVTGHAHTPSGDRVTAGGKRVRIGSRLELHEPLHIWQSWNGEIHKIVA